MGLLSWIIFGGLAGWAASILLGRSERMGCLTNVIIGIVGAGLGGLLVNLLGITSLPNGVTGFNLPSFATAVIGAVLLLGITGWFSRK